MTEKDQDLAELNALFDFDSDHHYQNLACWSALTSAKSFAKRTHDKYQSLQVLLKTLQSESFKWSGVINTIDSAGNLQSRIDSFPYTLEVVSFANQKYYLTNNRESDEVAKQYKLPNISSSLFLSLADELNADTIGELELFLSTHKEQREKFFDYMTAQPFFDFKESVIYDEFDDWNQVRLEQKTLEKLVSTKYEKKKPTHKI